MSDQIITVKIVEIDLVRSPYGHIFYNRRENGRHVVSAQPIDRRRARQIYEANHNAPDAEFERGRVDFRPTAGEWSWTVRLKINEETGLAP